MKVAGQHSISAVSLPSLSCNEWSTSCQTVARRAEKAALVNMKSLTWESSGSLSSKSSSEVSVSELDNSSSGSSLMRGSSDDDDDDPFIDLKYCSIFRPLRLPRSSPCSI